MFTPLDLIISLQMLIYSVFRLLTEDPHQRLGARGASEVILVLNDLSINFDGMFPWYL